MFIRLVLKNVKRSLHDYLIYFVTLILLSALMLSSYLLGETQFFGESGGYVSNSLPVLIGITLFCLMIYINLFMIKRRSREFALYLLSGLDKRIVSWLFLTECLLIGALALIFGCLTGSVLFEFIVRVVQMNRLADYAVPVSTPGYLKALWLTGISFLIFHGASVVVTIFKFQKQNIREMMCQERRNETHKPLRSNLISGSIAIGCLLLFIYQINHVSDMVAASTLSVTVGVFLYCSYSSAFGMMQEIRERKPDFMYKGMRLFMAGMLLSKTNTMVRLSVIISASLICAAMSFMAGTLFLQSGGTIMGVMEDISMGLIQLYMSVLFLIIIFTVTAIRQIVDAKEHESKYTAVQYLGIGRKGLNHLILKQTVLNVALPVFMASFLSVISLVPLDMQLSPFFRGTHVVIQAFMSFNAIFLVLFLGYTALAYISSYRYETLFNPRQDRVRYR